ncbi:unnamed protein product [Tuber aestivum]|uniref:Methyltransferase type 11 domain-containing protein n=1 Tax=Tuber aestivum TaxID=59557 RepID=A0A292PNK2_9PEZI|nr:unnamed protein product [Tuber aestivum]
MRNRPPPLLRLSAEKGHSAASPIDDFGNSSTSHHSLTPTRFPSPETSNTTTSNHSPPRPSNIAWSPSLLVPSLSDPPSAARTSTGTRSRSLSSGVPSPSLFPPLNMFKINTRARSPRRATSAMYPSMSDPANNPTSPATSMAVTEPLPRPFSPWGSTDSSTSTSPRASRMHKGFFGKRSGSPTASLTATSAPASSVMAKGSKGFLGRRPRKNSPSYLDPDFDPTTFRKNRTRPAFGAHGQDALYQEYEYLFDDSLEDSVNSEEDLSSHPSDADGNDDEDGYYLLRIKESVDSFSPRISPRTRSPPRSVPMSHRRNTSSGSLSDTPPTPPPKFRRSLVVTTTTPPRSSTTSLEEQGSLTATTVVSTPPTPPPKPTLFLDTECVDPEYVPQVKSTTSEASPPRRPPPPTPDVQDKRFTKRLSKIPNRPTSIPEGLGIINIPSPTLFYSSFIPGASDTWCGIADHATGSPALTNRSYTPRQPAAKTDSYDETIAKSMSVLFDEEPGVGVVPLFSAKDSSSSDLENTIVKETEMTEVTVEEVIAENPGDLSAATENPIECPLNQLETTDSAKKTEEERKIVDKTRDSKDTLPEYSATAEKDTEADTAGETNNRATVILSPITSTTNQGSSSPKTIKNEGDEKPATSAIEKEETPKTDSSYLKAFRGFVKRSGDSDPFIHRMPRFDALQAQRICNHLRSDYPLLASGKKARSGSPDEVVTATVRQREAEEGILTSLWALMALRWMNFGRVVISPGHETLLAASAKRLTRRATTKMDQRATQMLENVSSGIYTGSHERRRVLDLGGAPIADWGWHCAYDYPKAKVYTVTTASRPRQQPEGEEKASRTPDKCRGPQNHRPLVVSKLWKLPFPQNHFDVVSARTLYLALKATVPANSPDNDMDEYDLCLEECLRVLKPGGHLEFSLFDNDIVNAGPLGAKLAAKFSKVLESKGYDAAPTKRWVSRLNRAGFGEIKRSWIFLPMSPPCAKPKVPSKGEMQLPPHESQDLEMVKEEVRRKLKAWEDPNAGGGSVENVSPITGLVGSWIWEKWMMKTEGESDGECDLTTDTIGDVLEEGREKGSGWRCLVGWARKPMFAGEH